MIEVHHIVRVGYLTIRTENVLAFAKEGELPLSLLACSPLDSFTVRKIILVPVRSPPSSPLRFSCLHHAAYLTPRFEYVHRCPFGKNSELLA
jgi:hypothetical protein